jgi:hypothetical protein
MNNKENKSIVEPLFTICVDASKNLSEDFPDWLRPIVRVPIFCLMICLGIIVSPIVFTLNFFRKKTINPFFKLRTELETKWTSGKQDEALSTLREVRKILFENQMQIFFKGVQVPQYGRFKFNEFLSTNWLLYNWEFHSGNFQEASEVCDYFVDTLKPKHADKKTSESYWEEWVLNKAKAINMKDGNTATQEYLLKYVEPKNENCRINKYLYEIRDELKRIV